MKNKLLLLLLIFSSIFGYSQSNSFCFNFTEFLDDFTDDKFPPELKKLMSDGPLGAEYMEAWNYLKRGDFDFNTRTNTDLVTLLQKDVSITKYNLKEIFENDPREIHFWKQLKDDPYFVVEKMDETLNPEWIKWKSREFWIANNAKGTAFNKHMSPRIRNDLESIGVNLKGSVQIDELDVINTTKDISSKIHVKLDNAFIKEVFDIDGNFDHYKVIYNDNKFGIKSPWTDNQKSEIIYYFRDNPSVEFIELEIRSSNKIIQQSKDFLNIDKNSNLSNLNQGTKLRLYRDDIYKTISNGNNQNPKFEKIIKMNDINFKNQ